MKNFAWSFFNTFLSKGFSFIFSIILGNLLLPDDLGIFVTVLLVITYIVSIFSFGIGQTLVQKLNDVREYGLSNHYFTSGVILLILSSLLASLLFLFFYDFVFQLFELSEVSYLANMIVWLVPLNIFREYFSNILQANIQFRKLTFFNLSSVSVQILVTIILIQFYGMNIAGVFYGLYAGGIVALLLLLIYVAKKYAIVFNKEVIRSSYELLRFSSFIFVGSFALILDRRIDVLFVSYFLDNSDVAIYNYALKFSLLFLLAGNSMSKVTYPKLTNAFSSGENQNVSKILAYSLDFAFLGLSVLSLIFLLNADFLLNAILPSYYLQVLPLLPLLFIGILPKAVFASVGTLFTAKGLPSLTAKINWLMVSINIVLNIILIPVLGLYGAAIATSISFLGQPVAIVLLLKKHMEVTHSFTRMMVNFILVIALIIVGSQIENIWIRESIIIGYAFYAFFIFLSTEKQHYFLNEIKKMIKPNLNYSCVKFGADARRRKPPM